MTLNNKRRHYAKDTNLPLNQLLEALLVEDNHLQLSNSKEESEHSSEHVEYHSLSPIPEEVFESDEQSNRLDPEMEEFMQSAHFISREEDEPSLLTKVPSPAHSHDSSDEEQAPIKPASKTKAWQLPSLSDFKWPSMAATVATFAARSLSVLTLGGLLSTPVVGLVTFVGTYVGQVFRENFKKSSHEEVFAQQSLNDYPQQKLVDMDEATWQAARHGFEAQKSFLNQFKSCARPSDWTHPKAFYAGYRHSEIDPQMDLDLVEQFRASKLK